MREWFGLSQVFWLKPLFLLLENPLIQGEASMINILPMHDEVNIITSMAGTYIYFALMRLTFFFCYSNYFIEMKSLVLKIENYISIQWFHDKNIK